MFCLENCIVHLWENKKSKHIKYQGNIIKLILTSHSVSKNLWGPKVGHFNTISKQMEKQDFWLGSSTKTAGKTG
jgi:hypothetical protein